MYFNVNGLKMSVFFFQQLLNLRIEQSDVGGRSGNYLGFCQLISNGLIPFGNEDIYTEMCIRDRADAAAALVISFAEVLILLAYLVFVLGISFGNQIGYVLLTCLAGCVAGISLGNLIGTVSRGGEGVKIGLVIGTSMTMSFLAGLMWVDMKYAVASKAPVLSYINPAALISDAFYSLYAVSYTHLDVYKRQPSEVPSAESTSPTPG